MIDYNHATGSISLALSLAYLDTNNDLNDVYLLKNIEEKSFLKVLSIFHPRTCEFMIYIYFLLENISKRKINRLNMSSGKDSNL